MPDGIGNPPDGTPPPELDYDMWLGPAPKRPYNPNRSHYTFRYFWDYSGGKMTDWGAHLIDIIHWGMGVDAPLAVAASGGKYVIPDNRETPDTMEAIYDYPGFTMVYSFRGANERGMDGQSYGIQFHGTKATLFVDRGGFEVIPEEDQGAQAMTGGGSSQNEPHVRNFLDCAKSRERPICDIEIAHRSTTACHLGNIALLRGRKIYWDRENERITNDEAANRLLTKAYRAPWHL
jgi:predicted dehydrogenase